MINYSIVYRSVNANLLDINKAKKRINEARTAGSQPLQEDLDLAATEKQKAFAIAQVSEVMTIDKLSRHIAAHGSVYNRGDITAVLNLAVDCIREQLLEGKKIRLGDMGDFNVMLDSMGADNAKDFSANCIKDVTVKWTPGEPFQSLRSDAEFNLVSSRKAQAAVLKAIKAGQTVVDIDPSDEGNSNGNIVTPTPGGNTTSEQVTITVVASPSNGGSVTGGGTVAKGSSVTLKATANSGYTFYRWSDGNTSAQRNVTASSNTTYTAQFNANTPATGGNGDD